MAETHRDRYYRLKVEGKCVYCTAGLPEDTGRVFCVECSEKRAVAQKLYYERTKPDRKAHARKYRASLTLAQRNAFNVQQRQDRRELTAIGMCPICRKRDHGVGRVRCDQCHDATIAAQRVRRARLRSKVAGRQG